MKLALALSAALAASPAMAGVIVSDAWIKAPPIGAPTAAGYLTIRNTAPKPDRLLGGMTPAAASLGVHSMRVAGGIMRMRAMDQGLELPPGATVKLQPGGDHLMLAGLKQPLRAGTRVSLRLNSLQVNSG